MSDSPARSANAGIRSWAVAPVEYDGLEVGSLFVADRRRRWFDDEELRHLGLMTFVAGSLLVDFATEPVEPIDVRVAPLRLATPA